MNIRALIVFAIAVAAALLFGAHKAPEKPLSKPEADEARWRSRIEAVGGAAAYLELAANVASSTPENQHVEAHAFGGALFDVEGESGLAVCDAQFSFGCFHEFLGRAIARLGLDSVGRLNEECHDALPTTSLSCQHGIGHGLISYFGYTANDLRQALTVCKDLPYSDPIGGCYGGVLMEYNLRTVLGSDGRIRKNSGDLQAPCSELPSEYLEACYFNQPQWWHQRLKEDGEDSEDALFKKLGELCSFAVQGEIDTCFRGIGNIAAPSGNFDPERMKTLCEISTESPRNQLLCKAEAANSLFFGGAGKTGNGEKVCAGLEGSARTYCISYAKNIGNAVSPLEVPSL